MDFRLLGPMIAVSHGRPVAIGRRQERRLLALLLLEAGRLVTIDRIADLLWSGAPPPSARAAVHTYVGRLRAALRAHGVKIVTHGKSYLAEVDPAAVDVHRFTALIARGQRIDTPAERAAVLAEAMQLWRGPLLADIADDTLRARLGTHIDELHLVAAELLAEARLACGRHDDAVAGLSDLVAFHPTRERLVGLLMTALNRAGRREETVRVFERTRDLLEFEFGTGPPPELRRLHTAALNSDPHRSRGDAVRSGWLRLRPPADLADFVGRSTALARLDALLIAGSAPGARSVVLTGPTGVGKTALAVHWAHRHRQRFVDGQFHLDLRGDGWGEPVSPLDALQRLLTALGVRTDLIPAHLTGVARLYRAVLADRQVLVILDNAGSDEQMAPLLPSGADSVALVTSRNGLGAGRPGRLRLGPLQPAESIELLGADLVATEPDATPRLAHLCAHHPVVLRVAAAHVRSRPGAAAAARLVSVLDTEAPDADVALGRIIDQVYDRLPVADRRLFRRLGAVGVPGVDHAAAAVLGGLSPDAARAALDRLRAAELVRESAADRYRLPDLVRGHARRRAEREDRPAERERAAHRLLAWCLDQADDAAARTRHRAPART